MNINNLWVKLHALSVQRLGYDPYMRDLKKINKGLQEQLDKLQAWRIFEHQASTKQISSSKIRAAVLVTFGRDALNDFDKADKQFKCVDIKHFKKWLILNPTDKRTYDKYTHDCDEFSDILMGDVAQWDGALAFGTLWIKRPSKHALNWLIDLDNTVWIIEPQTDKIFRKPADWTYGQHIKM